MFIHDMFWRLLGLNVQNKAESHIPGDQCWLAPSWLSYIHAVASLFRGQCSVAVENTFARFYTTLALLWFAEQCSVFTSWICNDRWFCYKWCRESVPKLVNWLHSSLALLSSSYCFSSFAVIYFITAKLYFHWDCKLKPKKYHHTLKTLPFNKADWKHFFSYMFEMRAFVCSPHLLSNLICLLILIRDVWMGPNLFAGYSYC